MNALRLVAAALSLMPIGVAACAAEEARYRVTVEGTWTAADHPYEYPSDAHFSWLTGATHDESYELFEAGGGAMPGLEALAENGDLSPYDTEIQSAIDRGAAGALIQARPIERMPGATAFEITVDQRHPLVSLVTMIAPSPDWFTGVLNVRLLEHGEWVGEKTELLEAWDAGTDSGATFKAPDVDTSPREVVRLLDSEHFTKDGKTLPVGRVTFQRL